MLTESTSKTQKNLVAQNKDLRERLEEAEETLRAIRSGEVDALVLSSENSAQLFTFKEVENALLESEEKFRRLVEHLPSVVYMNAIGNSRLSIYVSLHIKTQLGYTQEEWLADPKLWSKSIHPGDRKQVLAVDAHAEQTNTLFDMEYRMVTREGRLIWVHDQAVVVNDLEGNPKFRQGIRLDITEQKQTQEALLKSAELLREESIRDHLTGLFNRRYMEETLERELHRALRKQNSLGIIMLDVDDFKGFNDTCGHAAGDAILRELGGLLLSQIRGEDIACRYGGDEFIVVLPDASRKVTRERAEQICEHAGQFNIQSEGKTLEAVALSLGVAVFPDNGSSGEAVLKSADDALYRAKQEGRGRVIVAG